MRGIATTAMLVFMVLLNACATTPEDSHLYSLPASAAAPPAKPRSVEAAIVVAQVQVAEFLQRTGIVYMTSPGHISAARRHRWAGPLPTQLRRRLYNGLSARLPRIAIYTDSSEAPDDAWRLAVMFDQFHGRYDGKALVGGHWRLRAIDGGKTYQSSFKESIPLAADGYDALVKALSKGLSRATTAIAKAIRQLPLSSDSGHG